MLTSEQEKQAKEIGKSIAERAEKGEFPYAYGRNGLPEVRLWVVAHKKYYAGTKYYAIIIDKIFRTPEEAKAESEAMNAEGKETSWGEIVNNRVKED